MSGRFSGVPTATFQEDIERLEEHIVQGELASHTPDDTCLMKFRGAVERGMAFLSFARHTCRRPEVNGGFRELIVPFGHAGCVVLFAIRDADVFLLAARDQQVGDCL